MAPYIFSFRDANLHNLLEMKYYNLSHLSRKIRAKSRPITASSQRSRDVTSEGIKFFIYYIYSLTMLYNMY